VMNAKTIAIILAHIFELPDAGFVIVFTVFMLFLH